MRVVGSNLRRIPQPRPSKLLLGPSSSIRHRQPSVRPAYLAAEPRNTILASAAHPAILCSMSSSAPTLANASGPPSDIDLTLQRVQLLLARLGSPQDAIPVIHVAGTNSKGSTTAYLDSLLLNTVGLRTGRFNSPHLVEERDCCRICGKVVRKDIWEEAKRRVAAADEGLRVDAKGDERSTSFMEEEPPLRCTPFEKLTAQALTAFVLLPPEERPEVLLIEVGLGGRLDATNVFSPQHVLASVICPIDLDHQKFLGNTLRDIAREKAGIVKTRALVVIADQRRPPAGQGDASMPSSAIADLQFNTELPLDSLRHLQAEQSQLGAEAAEIQDSIREVAFMSGARVVKSYVPWQALQSAPVSSQPSPNTPWSRSALVNARYAPILWPSTSTSPAYSGTYASRAGDTVVAGPSLQLPQTRAAFTAVFTALQALWAIARDETPSGLGQDGSDPFEEIRLKIAWALRDDKDANESIRWAVNGTRWYGRCEWVDVEIGTEIPDVREAVADAPIGAEESDDAMKVEEPSTVTEVIKSPKPLHLLVDGAHNPSAAHALRTYMDQCILSRLSSLGKAEKVSEVRLTITWILSISEGKDADDLLGALFHDDRAQKVDEILAKSLQSAHISDSATATSSDQAAPSSACSLNVHHRVALVPFSTPVEGMPWVRPIPSQDLANRLRSSFPPRTPRALTVESFSKLQDALAWASEAGDGKTLTKLQDGAGGGTPQRQQYECALHVLAGSLYLVSDLYRFYPRLLDDQTS